MDRTLSICRLILCELHRSLDLLSYIKLFVAVLLSVPRAAISLILYPLNMVEQVKSGFKPAGTALGRCMSRDHQIVLRPQSTTSNYRRELGIGFGLCLAGVFDWVLSATRLFVIRATNFERSSGKFLKPNFNES
jgi:hypothetical protein